MSARQCTATRRLGQPSTLRRFSLSPFTLRVARFLFLFCFRARGAYRPAATRAQNFCKQVSFFRPVFACAHLFVSRFLVCARVLASDVSWNDFFIRHLHLSRTLATSSSLFARHGKWCLQHLLWSRFRLLRLSLFHIEHVFCSLNSAIELNGGLTLGEPPCHDG